jgi:uncharacterized protein YjiS (DUF1127 family)
MHKPDITSRRFAGSAGNQGAGRRRRTMTMITHGRKATQNAAFIPDFLSRVSSRVDNFVTRSRAERQLQALDDRLLSDIGLKRSDIHKMVWGN